MSKPTEDPTKTQKFSGKFNVVLNQFNSTPTAQNKMTASKKIFRIASDLCQTKFGL